MTDALKGRIRKELDFLIYGKCCRTLEKKKYTPYEKAINKSLTAIAKLVDEEYKTLSEDDIVDKVCRILKNKSYPAVMGLCAIDITQFIDVSKEIASALVGHIPRKQEELPSEGHKCPFCAATTCYQKNTCIGCENFDLESLNEWVPHIVEEGSREHVISYDSNGTRCSCQNCELNKSKKPLHLTQEQIDAICAAEGYTREMLGKQESHICPICHGTISEQQYHNCKPEGKKQEDKSPYDIDNIVFKDGVWLPRVKPEGSDKI